jgi:hypothetical protein
MTLGGNQGPLSLLTLPAEKQKKAVNLSLKGYRSILSVENISDTLTVLLSEKGIT